jgi:cyclopropane-fatty-acyl-phospholipid synthase
VTPFRVTTSIRTRPASALLGADRGHSEISARVAAASGPEGQFRAARFDRVDTSLVGAVQQPRAELGLSSVGSLPFAVADRNDLEFTYSLIDRIFRLSLGELADFSGARYDADFSMSLEDAQRRKHEYVAERIGIGPGRRTLDLGCGWGPLLHFVRERGGEGVGVTLSSAQAESCRRHGLNAHLIDVREIHRDTFGPFDAVASLGAFEHFCSPEDYRAGRQDDIYRDVFARAASVLPDRGRLYLQTMVFGRNMIPIDAVSIKAPRHSDAWYLALMQHQFPGSFLPFGSEQVIHAAEPYFGLVESSSGRRDYIETIKQWRARFAKRSVRKTLIKARLVPRYLTSREFRLAFASGVSANSVCFERELLDHFRLVFEKR